MEHGEDRQFFNIQSVVFSTLTRRDIDAEVAELMQAAEVTYP